ncbi:L,D-transpeptidase family protein [Hymenobacter sp. GOD-10R]|uniref:L,D-transpeptidase family protein n=1 Tax=Hymenobacter sp. GOD-10R TaxID=3093922 RepID=UPI002D78E3CF|nr:L,D-transpeptidase family protein [Hymenobacter sp. GOD-10R]WRQ30375.1 L,D-transpeptidase family protein [Hymenobacter sp. GOD-10R]
MVVNIPAYSLQVIRGAQVVASYRVVVGKADTPTPELYSQLTYFQAAPEWRVPHSIAVGEMLPQLRRAPNYLDRHGYKLYTAGGERANPYRINWKQVTPETFRYQVRQAPSGRNALGRVVFRFVNPYSIYLHDTPTKAAFRANNRALSHGCIRVEKPLELARFLLQRDDAAQAIKRVKDLQTSLSQNRTQVFSLKAPVPLYVRYLTCEAEGSQLRQLPDVYQWDNALAQAWNTGPSALAGVGAGQ